MTTKYTLFSLTVVFLTLLQLSTQRTFPALPYEVLKVMGSRDMRYHHFLWHNLRELWSTIDNQTKEAIADLGWAPPRASLVYDENLTSTAIEDNFSGEDFLYMHKQMVKETNRLLEQAGTRYEKVVGFSSFPTPDDSDYPVPCNYVIPGKDNIGFTELVNQIKTDDFYYNEIVPTEAALKNATYLRSINLGQLGSRLEYTVHTWMHLRFSMKTPFGLRPVLWNPIPYIDEKWDDLSYQWLADTYSSHVNPIFWRIHGWVEDRIEDWRVANGLDEIDWQHTWEGGPEATISDLFAVGLGSSGHQMDIASGSVPPDTSNGDTTESADNEGDSQGRLLQGDGHRHGNIHRMEEVIRLLMAATGGKESSIYKRVRVLNPPADFMRQ